jgi:hypothetical protein
LAASTALLRATQEALNNTEAHGRAAHVEVRLRFEADAVSVEIDDDGAGFDAESWFERPELAAMSLSADAAVLSGLANDFDTRAVYARQVRALGHAGDVLLALSTTGNSANMLAAVEAAHERDMTVVALTGARGGRLVEIDLGGRPRGGGP